MIWLVITPKTNAQKNIVKTLQKSWLGAWQRAEVRIRAENGDNILNMVQVNQSQYTFPSLIHAHWEQTKTHQPPDKNRNQKDPKVSSKLIAQIVEKKWKLLCWQHRAKPLLFWHSEPAFREPASYLPTHPKVKPDIWHFSPCPGHLFTISTQEKELEDILLTKSKGKPHQWPALFM